MTTSDDTQDDTGATEEPFEPTVGSDDPGDPSTADPSTADPDTTTTDDSTTDDSTTDDSTTDDSTTDDTNTDDTTADSADATADSGGTEAETVDTDPDPGTTDPGETDSGETDSGSTDSGETESGSTDSGETESGDTDSDPAASESGEGATDAGTDAGTDLPADEATGADPGSGDSASATPVDLGPPYLIVDQYSGDSGMNPPWETLVGLPQYYGAILKAWEGAAFNDGGWFAHNWPAVRLAGADRYGSSWFRGAYLFLKFNASGAAQADAYLTAVDAAGGWDSGDILPVVDVELGGPANSNHQASKQQVIDCVSECTARLKQRTGRRVMLYGRGAMRDLQIAEKMGANVAWNPSYTPTMHKAGLEGFTLDEIVLWQYCGDNESYLPNYPHQVSGFAKLDISVFIKGSTTPTLDDVRTGLLT